MVMLADINNVVSQKFASLAGLGANDHYPQVYILDPNPGKTAVIRYPFNRDQITSQNVVEFVDEFTEGKLLPFRKVEKEPESIAKGYILALNSDTFEKVALDPSLDVFLFFTHSHCELCSSLLPHFLRTAQIFQHSPNLVFATLNLALNDIKEEHNVYYYPTLKYYSRDRKLQPEQFDQGLEWEDMVKFVKRVATVSLVEDHSVLTEQKTVRNDEL